MGLYKAKKSMSPKELVWPAKMIVATADAVEPLTFAQDASQTSPHPFIDYSKSGFVTMFEVLKPTSQCAVNVFDNFGQTATVAARGFGSNGISELLQTFSARPSSAFLKVIAEKVKPFSWKAHVNQSGLARVQSKTALRVQCA